MCNGERGCRCLQVVFTQVDGPIMVWLAPPPSNRMWVSFLHPPKIRVTAKPLNVNAMVQYTAMVRSACAHSAPSVSLLTTYKQCMHASMRR